MIEKKAISLTEDITKYLQSITFRGTPLWDRQRMENSSKLNLDLELFETRVTRWKSILGSEDLLSKRLKCNDLKLEDLLSLMGNSNPQTDLPKWSVTLSSILKYYDIARNRSLLKTFQPPVNLETLPFQDILYPLLQYYREQLLKVPTNYLSILSPEAHEMLERQFLSHVSYVTNLSLGVEFSKFRFNMAPASVFESAWSKQKSSRVIYGAFVKHFYGNGIYDFFDQYPVLARLLCQTIEFFILSISTFCQRFFADFHEVKKTFYFQINEPKNAISKLITNLSDRHNNGQTVFQCILSTGDSVIYKPRSISPEISFYNFIKHFNGYGLRLKLKTISAVSKFNYGWIETVNHKSCSTLNEVENFYVRIGYLLAILHVLSITDVHFENLYADGEFPVIIDLETLLDNYIGRNKPGEYTNETSILRTGLLPRWQKDSDGKKFDLSGLGADELQNSGLKIITWQYTNTDQMHLVNDTRTMMSLNHRVFIKENFPSANEFQDSLLSGFKEAYFSLLNNREHILNNYELLQQFDNLELRTLVRDTSTYSSIQLHLLHPEFLKDGIDRSIELEWLARPLMGTKQPREKRIILYKLEREAMEQLDVPHFNTSIKWPVDNNEIDEDFEFFNRKRDSRVIRDNLEKLNYNNYKQILETIRQSIKLRFKGKK